MPSVDAVAFRMSAGAVGWATGSFISRLSVKTREPWSSRASATVLAVGDYVLSVENEGHAAKNPPCTKSPGESTRGQTHDHVGRKGGKYL